jgi:hypothetical protein
MGPADKDDGARAEGNTAACEWHGPTFVLYRSAGSSHGAGCSKATLNFEVLVDADSEPFYV